MQHYLRQALLTLLSHPEPQTVIELVRVLTDDSLRDEYLDHVDDPMLSAFWRTEWPGPRERDRDTSIKAVLNKLGAFVSYGSIRQVVGQGTSTLRPRQVMDDGDLLVVDLSRVGGDNAQLFGAMLVSRYYVDAVGRQGTSPATRRPHLLATLARSVRRLPSGSTSRRLPRSHEAGPARTQGPWGSQPTYPDPLLAGWGWTLRSKETGPE